MLHFNTSILNGGVKSSPPPDFAPASTRTPAQNQMEDRPDFQPLGIVSILN